MSPFSFYTLTIIAILNLVIGFMQENVYILLVAFAMALYLKPHLKYMPIPKAYLKWANIDQPGITLEELKAKGQQQKKKKK